jgi:P-type E1-E2 ATPase
MDVHKAVAGSIITVPTGAALPAIVTVSLSTGAKRLAEQAVIVKRLVSIEDLGNIEVFFTDKTGTLTEGRISFAAASVDELRQGSRQSGNRDGGRGACPTAGARAASQGGDDI